jgi:predicted dienelactone hydrolase
MLSLAARLLLALVAACLAVPAAAQQVPADYRLSSFALLAPGGPHPVGTHRFEVPQDKAGPLQVVAWYPAAKRMGAPAPYFDAEEKRVQVPAVARNFLWPAGMLADVAAMPTNAFAGAPVASGRFPLLIFSHGYYLYPRQNSWLMEHLASRGYVILSLGHPGDAADLPTTSGVVATDRTDMMAGLDRDKLLAFYAVADGEALKAAIPGFFAAQRGGRMQNSLVRWRADIRALTDAVLAGRFPDEAQPIARAVDGARIAYGGMSFGGSSSASACQVDPRCRAAFNLDGLEFDETLYDRPMRMPLLLVQSDWHAFPNLGAPGASFTHYDYAYEPWATAGQSPTVYRFTLKGTRHMGLVDLALAPSDPVRDQLFGPTLGTASLAAINDLVTAFLDRHVAGATGDPVAAAGRHIIVEVRKAQVPQP